jgi:hypothetical protein
MKSVLRIYRNSQINTKAFYESETLANSWSANIHDFEIEDENLNLHGVETLLPNKLKKNIYEFLTQFSETEELLILPLTGKDAVSQFLHDLPEEDMRHENWQVVYNNYARFAFLESSKDFSIDIPYDTKLWVKNLVEKYGVDQILGALDVLSKDIWLLGETIIDEYIYCDALGKVSKDPIIAFKLNGKSRQLGGILAASQHVEKIVGECSVITEISLSEIEFVKNNIGKNTSLNLVNSTRSSLVVKTRYVDAASNSRVFETYAQEETQLEYDKSVPLFENFLNSITIENLIIIDFGHGLLSFDFVRMLLRRGIKLSVNAQSNAGNRGFNPISRYRGANRIFINGPELEIEARNNVKDRKTLLEELAPTLECEEIFVTQGAAGLMYWTKDLGIETAPGFAPFVIDRVGAGDALLSTVSALRINQIPIDIAAFYGNIAGAHLVSTMGNSINVSRFLLKETAREIIENSNNHG